ncbi:MAG TPA: MarR family transcriptional regulator [Kiloniellales bacterium]|nr:MarR family transcriptional regulator [Kiloniellales bacterium]
MPKVPKEDGGAQESESAAEQMHLRVLAGGAIATAYKIGFLSMFYSGPIYKITEPKFGISRPDFIVLLCLSRMGEANVSTIIRSSGQPRANISRATVRLERRKLIASRKPAADGRQKLLTLTQKGEQLLAQLLPMFVERYEQMFSVLTRKEMQQLDKLLMKLAVRDDGWIREY